MNNLTIIKTILDSDAGLLIEDLSQSTIKTVIDNRFFLIKQNVDLAENKDDNFYTELLKLIASYLDQLYDKKVQDFPRIVFSEKGKIISQDYTELNSSDIFNLTKANRELSKQLFDYVCSILENNQNVKLDITTLKRLLNRNPQLFTLSVETTYLYRPFNYERLVKIINENQTMRKSNISIENIYQLLLDTCQLNNENIFKSLVTPEQFKQNFSKINEILMWCDAESFVEITNIIRRNFYQNFDRFSIVKKRNKDNFCERLIIALLHYSANEDNFNLIHQILTDIEIDIDYNFYFADYIGPSNLKSIIALNGNRTIIKDLLSKEQNIQNYYSHGDQSIQLYILYATTGSYEKAIAAFEKNYNFKYDLYDDGNTWDKSGSAYGNWCYKDSLARFINSLCHSFKEDNIDYSMIIKFISRVINNENVKYINLKETLSPIQEILSVADFKLLIGALLEKHKSGNLEFLSVDDHEDMLTRFIINIANETEVQIDLECLKREKI